MAVGFFNCGFCLRSDFSSRCLFILFIILGACVISDEASACTGYARKVVHLGEYSNFTSAEKVFQKAKSEFYYCSCGGFYTIQNKIYNMVNDCRFEQDHKKYNYDKYVDLQINAYKSGCPASNYEAADGQCLDFIDPTKYGAGESGSMCGGNPIDFSNGIKVQYETDFSFSSNNLLKYTRVYSSMDGVWIFPFEQKIIQIKMPAPILVDKPITNVSNQIVGYESYQIGSSADEYVSISRPNGSVYLFSRFSKKSDAYKGPAGVSGALAKTVSGWIYIDGVITETYNSSGQLTAIENPAGKVSIAYDISGTIVYADNYGNSLIKTPLNAGSFKISDNAGSEIFYNFTDGKLMSVVYADGASVDYHYENAGFTKALTGITDEENRRYASWNYDSNGKANLSTHANNSERIDLVYNTNNSVTENSISGKKTSYYFESANGRNRIVKVVGDPTASCLASDSHYRYDTNGYRKTFTDKNGNVTETLRNSRGLIETERRGLVWSGAADNINSTLLETAASQKTVTSWHATLALPVKRTYYGWNGLAYEAYKEEQSTYTNNNRIQTFTVLDLTNITEPYATNGRARVWTYGYSYYDAGQTQLQQQTVDGPRTDVSDLSVFNYDTSGNLGGMVNALGHTTSFSDYNVRGQVGNITDANGIITGITYTIRGWIDVIKVNGLVTADYDYYANGLLKKVTMADGSWLSYTYNDARYLVKIENNLGESIDYTPSIIDGQWRQEVVKDNNHHIVRQRQRVFDELGRLMTLQGQNGQSWQYRYDKNDNLKTENDALQQITSYQYDAQNRISETLDAEQNAKEDPADRHAVAFAYDIQGNIASVTDPRGNTTRYLHDGFGQLMQQASPDTGVTVFKYDEAGNLAGKTDARGLSSSYRYDALNRLTSSLYLGNPSEDINYSYDAAHNGNHGIGRMTGYGDANGITTLVYDQWGLASSLFCVPGLQCYGIQYEHNEAGQLASLVYPGGNKVMYGYDAVGRVDKVSYQEVGEAVQVIASNIAYQPFAGMKTITFSNGVVLDMASDSDGRVTEIAASTTEDILHNKIYSHSLNDNIESIADGKDSDNNRSYQYDRVSRLTGVSKGSSNLLITTYDYDEAGNRILKQEIDIAGNDKLNETLVYSDVGNRLISVSDSVSGIKKLFGYDENGNTTLWQNEGVVDFTYGHSNRMSVSDIYRGTMVNYIYNALGQRIVKIPNGDFSEATYYHFGLSGQILAEHHLESGRMLAENVYVNGLLLAQIKPENDSDGDGWLDNEEQSCGTDKLNIDSVPLDSDGDKQCNEADVDDDNDGLPDDKDAYPLLSIGSYLDTDHDGAPDNCEAECLDLGMKDDKDDDNDGVTDIDDAYVLISVGELIDSDHDGRPDDCDAICQASGMLADTDDDNDGVSDSIELANDLDKTDPADTVTDSDGDGYSIGQELVEGSNPASMLSIPASQKYIINVGYASNDVEFSMSWLRINNDYLELTKSKGINAGLRFSLPVKRDAEIVSSFLTLVTYQKINSSSLDITMENSPDAREFTSPYYSRNYLSENVSWKIEKTSPKVMLQSPDVSSLLSKVNKSAGWVAGNNVLFRLSSSKSGNIRFFAYESSPDLAAKLNIQVKREKWDSDNDGISDVLDNCPWLANASQSNIDADAGGDNCDAYPLDPLR